MIVTQPRERNAETEQEVAAHGASDGADRRHRPGRDGPQPGPQLRPPRLHRGPAQPNRLPCHGHGHAVRSRGHLRPGPDRRGVRRIARAPETPAHHGQRGPRHRRGDRRVRPAARARRHDHRRRQRALQGHPPPRGRAPPDKPPLRRHGRLRRRGGRAERPLDHARRLGGVLPVPRPDARDDQRARGRDPVLHAHRPGRRRPLRQDGAQRHRVRRHAAHRRGLRPAQARRRLRARPGRRGLQAMEHRPARLLPDRDHRRGPRPRRRGDRPALRGHRARPGRTEGHRPLDRAGRARPGRPGQRHRRGGLRPLAVRPRRPAPGRPPAARPEAPVKPEPGRQSSPTRSSTPCTRPSWSPTRRAGT